MPDNREGAPGAWLYPFLADGGRAGGGLDLLHFQWRGGGSLMRVSIVGTGYVGLVSGACLAELGHQVTCIDVNRKRIESLWRRKSPIFEAGLDELLERHVGSRLNATTDLRSAVCGSE